MDPGALKGTIMHALKRAHHFYTYIASMSLNIGYTILVFLSKSQKCMIKDKVNVGKFDDDIFLSEVNLRLSWLQIQSPRMGNTTFMFACRTICDLPIVAHFTL